MKRRARIKYRNKMEITAQILKLTSNYSEELSKTKIMYEALLSYKQLKDYLNILIADELLVHNDDTRTYIVTSKGIMFLNNYYLITQLIPNGDPADPANDKTN